MYDGCVRLMLTASTDLTQGLPSSLLSLVAMASICGKHQDNTVRQVCAAPDTRVSFAHVLLHPAATQQQLTHMMQRSAHAAREGANAIGHTVASVTTEKLASD